MELGQYRRPQLNSREALARFEPPVFRHPVAEIHAALAERPNMGKGLSSPAT